ncbi:MAG TPA: hypothetical protein VGM92_07685, partial [Candidatus Kapabacteria bacterium]
MVTIVSTASAQYTWTWLTKFPTCIGSAYFFDENHGLIGSGVRWDLYTGNGPCAIYRTTDGGLSWKASQVPTTIKGAVTAISMQDSLIGYASILPSMDYSSFGTFGGTSLWKTTDGGVTWFDPFHQDHSISCVYGQSGLLLFTKWDNADYTDVHRAPPDQTGGSYSFDGGTTWTTNFRRGNGIAFSDSLNGVISEMNDDNGGNNFWVTTDAGRSWQATTNQYESWSVYAMKGKGTYFCSNESQLYLPSTGINWSTDSGFTWQKRFSFQTMHFTGTIAGAVNELYFQTDTGLYEGPSYAQGLYRSDDLGASWHYIGGPSTSRDSRFAVTGCLGQVVYAFDAYGNVYKTVDGGDGTIHGTVALENDTIVWNPKLCGDTLNVPVLSGNCIPVAVDSIFLPNGSPFVWLKSGNALPGVLSLGDTAKVQLGFAPPKAGTVVSNVYVAAHAGSHSIWKLLTVISNVIDTVGVELSTDSISLAAGPCQTAVDSIAIADGSCLGVVLDSVTLSSGELGTTSSFPVTIPDNGSYTLPVLYSPDSGGTHTLLAHLYCHDALRTYDTTVSVYAQSVQPQLALVVDSTMLTIGTKYCNPVSSLISFGSNACDTVTIDSIVSSNGSFHPMLGSGTLASGGKDTVSILFDPDSSGTYMGTLHVYAHARSGPCDTILSISAANVALKQCETLSDTLLTMATTGCQSLLDTIFLGNQGCDSLYLDSILVENDSEVSVQYDSSVAPIAAPGSIPISFAYQPNDGISKSTVVHLFAHTPSRSIDTTVTLALSNTVPAVPLALGSDSLWLFTKYCQPVTIPFQLGNLGCQNAIDSMEIVGDSLGEFSVVNDQDTIHAGTWEQSSVVFRPDAPGTRSCSAHLSFYSNGKEIDTTITIAAENLTAPVAYLPSLDSLMAGMELRIPLMIQPTTDTFTVHSFAFHLTFNTDLLTPDGLDFTGVCDANIDSSKWTPEANGVSVHVWLHDTISDTARLMFPLVAAKAKVSLAKDTMTEILLDSFVTDREPTLAPCSIPSQTFTLAMACGDPLLLEALRSEPLNFSFISVTPNPSDGGNWDLTYTVNGGGNGLWANVYNVVGTI